jgi:exo-beta-1,3-glucanase (GH17 family)
LMEWSRSSGITVFLFEAFDEPWKGSPDPLEPEKHWGIFTVDRKPKPVCAELYAMAASA